jgi:GNAT superfamily N-acetyltransferase
MDLHRAIDVFCAGFATTRSFTHPYEVRRVGELWLMEDAPRTKGDPRGQQIVTCGLAPEVVARQVRRVQSAKSFLCVIWPLEADMEAETEAYRQLGYRLMGTEPFFCHDEAATPTASAYDVRRIRTVAEALQLKKVARRTLVRPRDLTDQPAIVRQFVAFDGDAMVGWVCSVHVSPEETWVSSLFVNPNYRRRGIGQALMTTMLAEDRALGYAYSILLATLTGALLYPRVGYRRIGTLRMFIDRRK